MESSISPFHDLLVDLATTEADPRVRRRAQCLLVLCASESQAEAARLVNTDAKTLRRWHQRLLSEGRDGLAE